MGLNLTVENLTAGYGNAGVIQGLDLNVGAGQLVVVLGPNGSGKTTLLRTIAGLHRNSGGRVRLGGRDVGRLPPWRRARAGISLVPEGRGRMAGLTVCDHLDVGRVAARRSDRSTDREADFAAVAEMFPVLADRMHRQSDSLSGGEMQMLAIGRAVVAHPHLLLLDEPTLGLAPRIARQVLLSLPLLRDLGTTVVVVEQRIVGLLGLADRVFFLSNGRLTEVKNPERLTREDVMAAYVTGEPADWSEDVWVDHENR